jgi:Protein kinase domain/WD40-like Beta Propeller Repeat
MTLAASSRLGPYEITAKLGEGGMGEVYRATDTKLKREVAIKVLPAAFTEDQERLARFEREAQLLAQLHHPNIASIFGLEESNGMRALVMELVEGPTLAERLAPGPLSLDESLGVALQIAQALEEAHDKGIIHRDLKPQNIKASREGRVKVLDFGLAKAMDAKAVSASAADLARSPTLMQSPTLTAVHGTQLGVILGTAAYMAPEQARGVAVDKRADIWAFGVVLYETLTGRRLFEGELVTDVLANVLKKEIDFAALPAETPSAVRRLLHRCLERNPKNRLHDIADARVVLDELIHGVGIEGAPVAAAAVAAPARRAWPIAVAVLAALAAGAIADRWLGRSSAHDEPGARWALAVPDDLTLSSAEYPQLAISEDGRLQAAVVVDESGTSRILLRTTDEFAARVLPETERANTPIFSPDAAWIGFFRDTGLFKIPVGGGPPIRLAEVSGQTRGATWSRDGNIYFVPDTVGGLLRVSERGGPTTAVTKPDEARDERTHRWPQALPDGSAVLFTCDTQASTEYYDDARIEAVRPATGQRTVLVEGASLARYAPGGQLVFARGGSLYAIGFDARALAVRGAPMTVAQGVATDVGSGAVQFAISAGGDAIWAPGGATASYQLVWMDRSGAESSVPIAQAPYNESELSPDGKKVALVGGEGGVADLWVADLERGTLTRLTVGEFVTNPVWTPDGARIVYGTRARGSQGYRSLISWKPADGSRDAEVLAEGSRSLSPSDVSGDGRLLVYSALKEDGNGEDLFLLPLAGAVTPQLLLGGQFFKDAAMISPDGRWLAYVSDEGGQSTVFVRPFPAGDGRWQISTPSGIEPRWSGDGRELLYRDAAVLYRVAIDTSHGFAAGRPERLFDRVASGGSVHSYALAPDGKRILTYRSPAGRGALRTIHLDLGFARRLALSSRESR